MDGAKLAVLTALRGVIDPEVGMDIVTMGLVYGIELTAEEIVVALTLTTRGCPLGATILRMAQESLEGVAGPRRVRLNVVWDPPWNPKMMAANPGEDFGAES